MLFDIYSLEPPNPDKLLFLLQSMTRHYGVGNVFCAGSSLLGRELAVLRLGNQNSPVLLVGGVHGSEWLTCLLLLRFAEDLLAGAGVGAASLAQCLARRGVMIMPCLNPDGVKIALCGPKGARSRAKQVRGMWYPGCVWQANAGGIDLNHNFDAGFQELKILERKAGYTAPGPGKYGGETPHSEPETKAAVQLCMQSDVSALYTFHSQGEEIYYRYGPTTPARSKIMADMLSRCSGYRVCEPEGTASHGGMKDWFIKTTSRPGFTIEIGRGKNPLPIREFLPIYARLSHMLTAILVL